MAETTVLAPEQEVFFRQWAKANGITDVDDPWSRYDYRGYWQEHGSAPMRFGTDHFTDTYKQHGHPTFSQESKYSAGPHDGGRWQGESFIPPGADLLMNSRGQSRIDPQLLAAALKILAVQLGTKR
jgi:hypothetical protein